MLKGLYEHVRNNGGFSWKKVSETEYVLYAAKVKTNIKINVYKNEDSYGEVDFEYEVTLFDFAKSYGCLSAAKQFGAKDLFMEPSLSNDVKCKGKSLAEGKNPWNI